MASVVPRVHTNSAESGAPMNFESCCGSATQLVDASVYVGVVVLVIRRKCVQH